eukprot:1626085-Prymnesium_polylepis.1
MPLLACGCGGVRPNSLPGARRKKRVWPSAIRHRGRGGDVRRATTDVLHPDHAPPPGKTDTHFTVR